MPDHICPVPGADGRANPTKVRGRAKTHYGTVSEFRIPEDFLRDFKELFQAGILNSNDVNAFFFRTAQSGDEILVGKKDDSRAVPKYRMLSVTTYTDKLCRVETYTD